MVHSFLTQISYFAMALICAFAGLKGGRPERLAALVTFAAWVTAGVLGALIPAAGAGAIDLILLGVDAMIAVALLALALRFVKLWLGAAMLIQSVELGLHGAVMADFGLLQYSYLVFNNVASYGLLVLLLIATLLAWRERAREKRRAPAGLPPEFGAGAAA